MLADVLEELTPQLARGAAARMAGARGDTTQSSRWLCELVVALREERVDVSARDEGLTIAAEPEEATARLRALKETVYQAIEERDLDVKPREMRLLGDWFAALTEHALRAENRSFAALLDALPDHVFLLDAEARFVYLNRAASEIVHLMGHAEPVGRSPLDIGFPDSFNERTRSLFSRVRAGETVREEVVLPLRHGGRWHEHHVVPLRDGGGKVYAIAVASRDVQARKIAEARLKLLSKVGALAETSGSERILDAIAQLSIPELADWCIVEVVENGQVRRSKVAHRDLAKVALAEQILRLSPDWSVFQSGRDQLPGATVLHSELDDGAIRARSPRLADVIAHLGASSVMSVPFVVLGASVAVATFVFTAESGRHHGPEDLALAQEMARLAAQTIENARLHDKVLQSEARFRIALARSNISVFETDADLRLRWSHNTRFGSGDQSLVGKSARDYMGAKEGAQVEAVQRRVLESGEGTSTELDIEINGERRHLLSHYEPLRSGAGIVGITGTAFDITEAKRVQEQLAQAVAFREQMMGVLGHDLGNPLSSVLGLAGLLQLQEGLSERAREGLRRIELSAERMHEMIKTILDFTQLRFRGPVPLSRQAMTLDVVARAIVDELQVAHPGRAIEIAAQGDLRGQWDPGRIGQVISNIVGNALTHGAGDAPVQLSLAQQGESVVVAVSNRGPTIPADQVQHLFEPFWQAPGNGELRRRGGLGLGLFIVHEIVRAHGGAIDVRSLDGVTTFTLRLPRAL
jgi:PAS domain S-box-containing protein